MLTGAAVGAGAGCAMAAAVSLVAVAQSAFDRGAAVASRGMTLPRVVAAYWVAALVAGALVGALRPWHGTRLGLALAGWLGGATVYGAVGLLRDGATAETAQMAAVLGLVAGVPAAFIMGGRGVRRRQRGVPPAA